MSAALIFKTNLKKTSEPIPSFSTCTDYDCIKSDIPKMLKAKDPAFVLTQMQDLLNSKKMTFTFDIHQFAHEVGRQTAKIKGVSGESFLTCTTEFNYGCQHGFFEFALGQSDSSEQAASKICGKLPNNLPSKTHFYCYHGLGHGILMAKAYDLKPALDVCDSLTENGQAGCWQGVFMENTNAAMDNQARDGIFSKSDPLAPCNQLDIKYKWQCYLNHSGYLMSLFGNGFEKAAASCLKAGNNFTSPCLQGLGLMVSNPTWQTAIAKKPVEDTPETYIELCKKFPQGYTDQCVIGTVDNIMNFDQLNIQRAKSFCNLVSASYKDACWNHIYFGITSQTTDQKLTEKLCNEFEKPYQNTCSKKI